MSMRIRLAMLSDRLRGRAPLNGAGVTGMAAAPGAHNGQDRDPEPAPANHLSPVPPGPYSQNPNNAIEDWDLMFDAIRARLKRTVGQRLGELPDVPQHSAELSASLVQAVVLECVAEMDKLHTALQQERSQRLTP